MSRRNFQLWITSLKTNSKTVDLYADGAGIGSYGVSEGPSSFHNSWF
jgi:hypothetical protein